MIATVRHLNPNHVQIVPSTGYSVVLFDLLHRDGPVEAVVAADDGSETIRLNIAAPSLDQTMSIKTSAAGVVDIFYRDLA